MYKRQGLVTIPILSSPDIHKGIAVFKVPPFQRNFTSYLFLALFFFASYYYIIPKFYVTKRWLLLILITVFGYLLVIKLPQYLISDSFLFENQQHPHSFPQHKKHNSPFLSFFLSKENHILQFLGVFILSLFLRVNEHLNKAKHDKLLSEISYLRSQINPHFLFNTLNSLYALVLTKSDEAPNAVLKLSELVRYIVSESNKKTISLEKEVEYIKNYIDLQKLRLTEKTKVITNFEGNFRNHQIVPLLLMSFIENAFKYGADVDNDSEIILHLTIINNNLSLDISNTIASTQKKVSTKKGISNTKEQLDIFYPNKHNLKVEKNNQFYKVNLEIELK